MNRGATKGGSCCWPAGSADGDIIGAKSFSQMVQKSIIRSKERKEHKSVIR